MSRQAPRTWTRRALVAALARAKRRLATPASPSRRYATHARCTAFPAGHLLGTTSPSPLCLSAGLLNKSAKRSIGDEPQLALSLLVSSVAVACRGFPPKPAGTLIRGATGRDCFGGFHAAHHGKTHVAPRASPVGCQPGTRVRPTRLRRAQWTQEPSSAAMSPSITTCLTVLYDFRRPVRAAGGPRSSRPALLQRPRGQRTPAWRGGRERDTCANAPTSHNI